MCISRVVIRSYIVTQKLAILNFLCVT